MQKAKVDLQHECQALRQELRNAQRDLEKTQSLHAKEEIQAKKLALEVQSTLKANGILHERISTQEEQI